MLSDFVRRLRRQPDPLRIAAALLLVGYFSGGVLTWAQLMAQAWTVSRSSDDALHAAILRSNLQRGPVDPDLMARAAEQEYAWYLIEGPTGGAAS